MDFSTGFPNDMNQVFTLFVFQLCKGSMLFHDHLNVLPGFAFTIP